MACLNCQNWSISQVSPKETQNFDLMPEKVVESCIDQKCESISYTYSEPFAFYEYVCETAKSAKNMELKIFWFRMDLSMKSHRESGVNSSMLPTST